VEKRIGGKMICQLNKQTTRMTAEDGSDVWDRTDYYQNIRNIEHGRIHKHFKDLTDDEEATYETCDWHYHARHYGKVTGKHENRSYGEIMYELCPDWVDKNPTEAARSSLRATSPDPWGKLQIAHADIAAFHAAKDFFKSTFQTLVINGGCGYGKTSLAKMVESDFLRDGLETCFVTCERLAVTYLETQPTKNEIDLESRQIILDMRRADVVVIDDLGTAEKAYSEFFKEQFKMFLDERRGKLVVTTNLTRLQLIPKLNDKIVSRIFENSRAIQLKGKDYRRGGK
jgi:DNA replication protein DnaC